MQISARNFDTNRSIKSKNMNSTMKSNTNTRNNVWEKRLDMSKDDKDMLPSKQTIDDVDEKINRLENDNFKLTMNS